MSARAFARSMAVLGGAQAIGLLIGLVRAKALALILGPAGVGVMGTLHNLQMAATTLASLGLHGSGVREVAAAEGDPAAQGAARRVLLGASVAQGLAAFAALWLARRPVAVWVFGDDARALEVGLIGGAVLLAVIAGSQLAMLQGLRRVDDVARVNVLGALLATAIGVPMIWLKGEDGLIWYLLALPAANVAVAAWRAARLPRAAPAGGRPARSGGALWLGMIGLGWAFMAGALVEQIAMLGLRSAVLDALGVEAAGLLQAAWAVFTMAVGVLLSSLTADYFPRLSAIIDDAPAASTLVDDQALVAMALGGPALIGLAAAAPIVLALLYSRDFIPAAPLLEGLAVGGMMRLVAWPVGFVLVARRLSALFLGVQILWAVVFLALSLSLMPAAGLWGVGVAFCGAYAAHMAVNLALARRLIGYRPRGDVLRVAALNAAGLALALAAAAIGPIAGALVGGAAAAFCLAVGGRAVLARTGPGGRLGRLGFAFWRRLGWPAPGSGVLEK